MMKIWWISFLLLIGVGYAGMSQTDARLLRYADVSDTHITFAYGGGVWIVPREGGLAYQLSTADGSEVMPRFSPDGKKIAFTGNYGGNNDVYVIPSLGGLPHRVTFHGMNDLMVDWSPDGNVLFNSSRKSGKQRFNQFYLVPPTGGLPQQLPMPFAEFGSFSPDGKKIVYTDRSRVFRNWKRYRGGAAADLIVFDLTDSSSTRLAVDPANDEFPMWHDETIYFLSDRGPEQRYNLWKASPTGGTPTQLTHFTEEDVVYPSLGPDAIVFSQGGDMYLFDLETENYDKVQVQVPSDQSQAFPEVKNLASYLQFYAISPEGSRALVQARGEVFSLPAEEGVVRNLTHSSGSAERYPKWSPDGRYIAYWSDASGEYQLTLYDNTDGSKRTITQFEKGYYFTPYWSPDSKKIAFMDAEARVYIAYLDGNQVDMIEEGPYMSYYSIVNWYPSWSPDSRFLAYDFPSENHNWICRIYDLDQKDIHRINESFYSCDHPRFGPEGEYLYVLTDRHFSPTYGSMSNWIYRETSQLAAIPLTKDIDSPLAPKNEKVAVKTSESETDGEDDKSDKKKKKSKQKDNGDDGEEKEKKINIDFNQMEKRMVILPVDPGVYYSLFATEGKLIFQDFQTGPSNPIKYYDIEEREVKTIIGDAQGFEVSADGKKMLAYAQGKLAIVSIAENQKMDKTVPTQEMTATIDPRKEWQQIFLEAWRIERDFFYDPNMHGVDWQEVYNIYAPLIAAAPTRWEVNFLIGQMIAELNASHAYNGGGETESGKRVNTGYLGVDWTLDNGHYRIEKIIQGAPWDVSVRSPLLEPGIDARTGDYLIAVNGQPVNPEQSPYAAFQGLAGKTVELTLNQEPSAQGARKVVVEPMTSETRLRNLAWIEDNRKSVYEASDGRIGYIYVPSTGVDGQNELVRQFQGQFHMDALLIDERFNNGGQIPDRFIELLNRPTLAYWARRGGGFMQSPRYTHVGPKAMLINGWSGSGGDAFPDYFKKANLGKTIGGTTWGGLIGISGTPPLIDGGSVTAPSFRMIHPDGTWFQEGEGVKPDIPVWEDPTAFSRGNDPQIEKAVEVLIDELDKQPRKEIKLPAYETR